MGPQAKPESSTAVHTAVHERFVLRFLDGSFLASIPADDRVVRSRNIDSAKLFSDLSVAATLARVFHTNIITVLVDDDFLNARLCLRRPVKSELPHHEVNEETIAILKRGLPSTFLLNRGREAV